MSSVFAGKDLLKSLAPVGLVVAGLICHKQGWLDADAVAEAVVTRAAFWWLPVVLVGGMIVLYAFALPGSALMIAAAMVYPPRHRHGACDGGWCRGRLVCLSTGRERLLSPGTTARRCTALQTPAQSRGFFLALRSAVAARVPARGHQLYRRCAERATARFPGKHTDRFRAQVVRLYFCRLSNHARRSADRYMVNPDAVASPGDDCARRSRHCSRTRHTTRPGGTVSFHRRAAIGANSVKQNLHPSSALAGQLPS